MEIHFLLLHFHKTAETFSITNSLATLSKTNFRSFLRRLGCNRGELAAENCKNMLGCEHFNPENFHYFFPFSLSLFLHHELFFLLCPATVAGVFCFVSCKSSSSLSTELVRWKIIFPKVFLCSRARCLSSLLSAYWRLMIRLLLPSTSSISSRTAFAVWQENFLFSFGFGPKFHFVKFSSWGVSLNVLLTSRGVN